MRARRAAVAHIMTNTETEPNSGHSETDNSEVRNAISVFEQILEAMPKDRAALDALSHAYEQIGDGNKTKEYLRRLGELLMEEDDQPAVQALARRLRPYADADPEVSALLARMRDGAPSPPEAAGRVSSAELAAREPEAPGRVRMTLNMADELTMAWNLMEAGQLTQAEYSSLVHDLTEMSSGQRGVTVSVLHALQARGFKNLEKVMAYLVEDCGTPIVAPESFEIRAETATILPAEFMLHRGAVVFELLGGSALVAVMNPYDHQLRRDVETLTGRKCHFFTCLPSQFDEAVNRRINLEETEGTGG